MPILPEHVASARKDGLPMLDVRLNLAYAFVAVKQHSGSAADL
jgi:hypothetical protein